MKENNDMFSFQDGIHNVINKSYESIIKHSVQIMDYNFDSLKTVKYPFSHASGVLIKSNKAYYILTAGHVIQRDKPQHLSVLLGREVHLIKGRVDKVEAQLSTDIALIKLENDLVTRIKKHRVFLDFKGICSSHKLIETQNYHVVGFPSSYNKINKKTNFVTSKTFSLLTSKVDDKWFGKLEYSKEISYLMGYKRKKVIFSKNNKKAIGPKPDGLSGCGLWYIPNMLIEKGQEVPYYLIGILAEFVREQNILVFTKVDVAIKLLNLD